MGRVGPLLAGQESINNKAHSSCVPAAGGGEVPVYDRCSTQFLDSIIATKFAPFFFYDDDVSSYQAMAIPP